MSLLESYGEKILVLSKENGGKPSALNLALKHLTGSHVLIFDDDDILFPDAISTHAEFLYRHPEYDYTHSPGYLFEGDFDLSKLEQYVYLPDPEVDPSEYLILNLDDLTSHMQGMVVAKRCYDLLGGFDESLLRAQDHDMAIRLARKFRSARIGKATHAIRQHRQARGPSFAQHEFEKRRAIWRHYQRRIFRKVYDEFSLFEYLANPLTDCDEDLTPQRRRQALIQRAFVVGTHGLYKRALFDLHRALSECEQAGTLSEIEMRLLSGLLYFADMRFFPSNSFFRRFGETVYLKREVIWAGYRGLYWTAGRHRKDVYSLARIGQAMAGIAVGTLSGRLDRHVG